MSNNFHTVKLVDIVASKDLVATKEPYVFVVMTYFPFDLQKCLNNSQNARLNEEEIKSLIYKLICAVLYLNRAGLMHRDIKPSNILVDKDLNIRICDFGLARGIPSRKSSKRKLSC